jgi:hypothetical protein
VVSHDHYRRQQLGDVVGTEGLAMRGRGGTVHRPPPDLASASLNDRYVGHRLPNDLCNLQPFNRGITTLRERDAAHNKGIIREI